jgi:hypothetical protein
MAVLLSGTGSWPKRIGRIGALINAVNAFRGTADLAGASIVSIGTGFTNLDAEFASALQQLMDGVFAARDAHRLTYSQILTALKTLAANVTIEMVDADTSMATKTLAAALQILMTQIQATADSIEDNTVSVTCSTDTPEFPLTANSGVGYLVGSVKDTKGLDLQYLFDETLRLRVTADSMTGGSTIYRETLSVKGDVAEPDTLSYLWPAGSGVSTTLTAVDAFQDASSTGNVLTNAGFETFTVANTPDNWAVLVGAFGTDILADAVNYYISKTGITPKSLKILGDGATLSSITQTFGAAAGSGTTVSLLPNTVYHLNFYNRVSAAPSAGVLKVDLWDGSSIINDDAGTANTITSTLTALTTAWTNVSGAFRTPRVLPDTVKLRIRLSTALDNAKYVNIDHMTLTPATQIYTGGPYLSFHAGTTKLAAGDSWKAVVANNYASAWAKLLDRLFAVRTLGIKVPFNTTETILDSLIA